MLHNATKIPEVITEKLHNEQIELDVDIHLMPFSSYMLIAAA